MSRKLIATAMFVKSELLDKLLGKQPAKSCTANVVIFLTIDNQNMGLAKLNNPSSQAIFNFLENGPFQEMYSHIFTSSGALGSKSNMRVLLGNMWESLILFNEIQRNTR